MTFNLLPSLISGITNASPAVVTTETNHGLTTGMVVKMIVPQSYGMVQLNNQYLQVSVLSPTTFSLQYSQVPPSLNVDTTKFNAFTFVTNKQIPAQVIPVGSASTPISETTWQIKNGFCNSTLRDTFLNNSTVEIPF